jgi:hypothetical protein
LVIHPKHEAADVQRVQARTHQTADVERSSHETPQLLARLLQRVRTLLLRVHGRDQNQTIAVQGPLNQSDDSRGRWTPRIPALLQGLQTIPARFHVESLGRLVRFVWFNIGDHVVFVPPFRLHQASLGIQFRDSEPWKAPPAHSSSNAGRSSSRTRGSQLKDRIPGFRESDASTNPRNRRASTSSAVATKSAVESTICS